LGDSQHPILPTAENVSNLLSLETRSHGVIKGGKRGTQRRLKRKYFRYMLRRSPKPKRKGGNSKLSLGRRPKGWRLMAEFWFQKSPVPSPARLGLSTAQKEGCEKASNVFRTNMLTGKEGKAKKKALYAKEGSSPTVY